MCKKLVIAALAVGLGLAVAKGTWLGKHARMEAGRVFTSVRDRIPPEQEIARLRLEVKNLERDDEKHYDKVARMIVAVDKLEGEVADVKKNLKAEEARLRALNEELSGNRTFVMHGDRRYTRDDLRAEAMAFKTAEESLQSKEASLDAQRKHLSLERQKLTQLRTMREQMITDLQRLETALAEERHAQAASESTIDDSSYRQLRKDMESVRERIEILKKKRELRGQIGVHHQDTRSRERNVQAEKYLEERFGGHGQPGQCDENQ